MTDLSPADLDAIEAIGRDAAYIAVRYPLRVKGRAILAKSDLLALVALARQAERYREALDTISHCDPIDGGSYMVHVARTALAEPAPGDGR